MREVPPPPARVEPPRVWRRVVLSAVTLTLFSALVVGGLWIAAEVRRVKARDYVLHCQRNLRELSTLLLLSMRDGSADEVLNECSGASVLLSFRVTDGAIKEGWETLFICPADEDAINPTPAQYDGLDLHDPEAVRGLCSYAVRDFGRFPLDPLPDEPQILACDRQGDDGCTQHHLGGLDGMSGINVAFSDGSVKFLTHDELGLSGDDQIVVGPDSTHPMLKKVRYDPYPR